VMTSKRATRTNSCSLGIGMILLLHLVKRLGLASVQDAEARKNSACDY